MARRICRSRLPIDALQALESCEAFWRDWSARATVSPPYDEAVMRSLITLKGLTYAPSGGIVAAPTASLPENIGGMRNWDYRYCWIRDSTFTLLALMDAGFYEEAAAWRDWLLRATAGAPANMQIMYGLMGERRLTEWEADWLPGYLDSRPVRFGNAAYRQFQLDVYGELMDFFAQARAGGLAATESGWALQVELVRHVGAEVARAGLRHLGDARSAAPFHVLEGHGLGYPRPCHRGRRALWVAG